MCSRSRVPALVASAALALALALTLALSPAAAAAPRVDCDANDGRDCDVLAAGELSPARAVEHLPVSASHSVTLLLSGRVAVISAADGRFLCAAGAAPFSSLRLGVACQFEVLAPSRENADARAGHTGKRGAVVVPQQTPLNLKPLP
jgi:hypothetical protein